METLIAFPQTKELEAKTLRALEVAQALVVVDQATMESANTFGADLYKMEKEIVSTFAESKEAAHKTHRAICAAEARHLEPVREARKITDGKIGVYLRAEEQKRREEEARLQEVARKAEEDRRVAEAEALEKAGEHEAAEQVISEPIIPQATVLPKIVKPAGFGSGETWDFEIIASHLIPREYLVPDLVAIRKVVVAMKDRCAIPGIWVFPKPTTSRRMA